MRPSYFVITSVVLSVIGAALDFVSASSFLIVPSQGIGARAGMYTMPSSSPTYHHGPNALIWSAGLIVFGGVLIVSAGFALFSMRRWIFGPLMVLYGIVMFAIGWLMHAGAILAMSNSLMTTFSSYASIGMFVVGALMIANGIAMTLVSKDHPQNATKKEIRPSDQIL